MKLSKHKELLKVVEDELKLKTALCEQLQQQLRSSRTEASGLGLEAGHASETIRARHPSRASPEGLKRQASGGQAFEMQVPGMPELSGTEISPSMAFSINTRGLKGVNMQLSFL